MYIYSGTTIVFLSNQYWLNSCFWQLKLKDGMIMVCKNGI